MNLPSSLRPVVEFCSDSRILLLRIKFLLRNRGDVAERRMKTCSLVLCSTIHCREGWENAGMKEGMNQTAAKINTRESPQAP